MVTVKGKGGKKKELKPGETGGIRGGVTNVTDPDQQKVAVDLARERRGLSPLEDKPEVAPTVEEPTQLPTSQEDLQADLDKRNISTSLAVAQNDFAQRSQGLKPLDEIAAYQQALLAIAVTGGVAIPGQFATGAEATAQAISAGNAAQKAAQPGVRFTPVVGNAAASYATNGKSLVKTAGLLLKSGFNLKTAPIIVSAIGSYPFAGFIKEEALQTLSFAIKAAKDSGDLEGEAQAISDMEEVLDPVGWNQILNKVPYANVLSSLETFYEAARTKLDIDKKSFEKRQSKDL